MKVTRIIMLSIALGGFMFISACQKDPGKGGKAHIHGHVEHDDDKIANAMVSIWYDTKTKPGDAADDATVSDAVGEFEFEGLRKGDYFVFAEATIVDSLGTEIKSGGVAVNIDKKSGEYDADIHVD